MIIYLPSMSDEELLNYAGCNATTELEKELLKRFDESERKCGVDNDVCQCCGSSI